MRTARLDSLNGVSTGQLIEIVHPTFLYELLWNLLVFAFLIWVDRRYRSATAGCSRCTSPHTASGGSGSS